MLCETCPKRETCTELCPEADAYVSQDYVGRRESLVPSADISDVFENSAQKGWPDVTKSKKELIFLMYMCDGLTQQQVAEKLNVSRPYVTKVVKEIRMRIGREMVTSRRR